MQILNRLTIRNLKLNKKRTIVTIIGIILATALLTAVAGKFKRKHNVKSKEGRWRFSSSLI